MVYKDCCPRMAGVSSKDVGTGMGMGGAGSIGGSMEFPPLVGSVSGCCRLDEPIL